MTLSIVEKATELLRKYYGYDSFRPLQAEIIAAVCGGSDALVLMPTGGGKSVCYQIPALMLKGITIVVSPLLALMKDQVDALLANGIPAAALNSLQSEAENQRVRELALGGKIRLLYISPERLLGDMEYWLAGVDVALFAIDEAHCISQWGHDFRPEYTQLSVLRKYFPDTPVMALTATADKITREDILKQLALRSPRVFLSSFDRPNIGLNVISGLAKQKKIQAILSFLDSHPRQSGIIYCLSRSNTEMLAKTLGEYGIEAEAYHAGLSAELRERAQRRFLNDEVRVICATIAFGMGIDKSNVRWVIHYNMPKSMECYYQEIGRAGRDGLPSDTLLFYSLGDVVMLSKFADDSGQRSMNIEKLRRMQQYAEASICRRRILLSYFGETYDCDCGNCDVCRRPPQRFDGTILVQKALSAIARTGEQVNFNLLIDILRGSHRAEIITRGFDKIKTFGVGADQTSYQWQGYLSQMLQFGYYEILYNNGNVLKITELGWKLLRGETGARLTFVGRYPETDRQETGKKRKSAGSQAPAVQELSADEQLFEALRTLRMRLAAEADMPAYTLFTDKVLYEMVRVKPMTLGDFARISGVGESKVMKYGREFVSLIRKELGQKSKEKGDTLDETLYLLQQGYTPAMVAEARALKEVTVCSHIAQLIQTQRFTASPAFIPEAEISRVEEAVRCLHTTELKPLYEFLQGRVSYGHIRIILAIISVGGRD